MITAKEAYDKTKENIDKFGYNDLSEEEKKFVELSFKTIKSAIARREYRVFVCTQDKDRSNVILYLRKMGYECSNSGAVIWIKWGVMEDMSD